MGGGRKERRLLMGGKRLHGRVSEGYVVKLFAGEWRRNKGRVGVRVGVVCAWRCEWRGS